MAKVLHVGAANGEIDFYSELGVAKLVYAEPDKMCLDALSKNVNMYFGRGGSMEIVVVPKACSARSGDWLNFYANGSGQSSLEKPQSRTIDMVGDRFKQYEVETISLVDLKELAFGSGVIDYFCVDTQGHEKAILCNVAPSYLRSNFMVIDVELMTDLGQYSVSPNDWKTVVAHLLESGFEPLIHPHGITESYIFINSSLNPGYFVSAISSIRDRLMKQLLAQSGIEVEVEDVCAYSSLGDHMCLPLTHIGGSIHATLLQAFREAFVAYYLRQLATF
jgi:FkbM family methyltransferase